MKKTATPLIALLTLLAPALAEDMLFVKNNFKETLYIRVNGEWQGYCESGKVVYMPQEGFATLDSGFQEDGSLKIDHAYGGWPFQDEFVIEAMTGVFKSEEEDTLFYSKGSQVNDGGYKRWGFGNDADGSIATPTDWEIENAGKMPKGRPGQDGLDLLVKGTANVTADDGSPVTGATGGGGSFALQRSGEEEEKAGRNFTNGLGMSMIAVKPGKVNGTMWEWDSTFVNRGVRQIDIDQPYYLAATEVTQAQWRAVMGDSPSKFRGDNLSVEQVDWNQAMDFCKRLTARESQAGKLPKGHVYTLPTEAQWEYACRAGTTGDYAGPLDAMAWYADNSGNQTHPVGTKRANGWGFYDMHGNVWEWCADVYNGSRAIRGGSWIDGADYCRSGSRFWLGPGYRASNLGFRPALVPSR